jgi:hypothetical protein
MIGSFGSFLTVETNRDEERFFLKFFLIAVDLKKIIAIMFLKIKTFVALPVWIILLFLNMSMPTFCNR